jgi:hypothetical protein
MPGYCLLGSRMCACIYIGNEKVFAIVEEIMQ